jgi:predicted DsbA family dithiol-disulfide isomerase
MRIDVWADLVCPWCYIGKRRLQWALTELGMTDDVHVVHRAFQLDPSASGPRQPTLDHLAEKYGVTREQALSMMANVTEVAEAEGLHYRLDRTMTGNTRDAHRALLWAQETQPTSVQPLLDDLYSAYFEQGESIFTSAELLPFAQARGYDTEALAHVLEGNGYSDLVAADQEAARALGTTGVPFFVFDERLGLSGAQPREVFLRALEQAATGEGDA